MGSQTHGLGLYVGSVTGQGCGIQRWSEYDRYVPNNLSNDNYSRKGYHYWFYTRPARTMNLRAVAVCRPENAGEENSCEDQIEENLATYVGGDPPPVEPLN